MSQPNEGQDRIDYRETADITEVHAAIAREHAEPSADVTPIPMWLSVVCAASLCWAGIYVGIFHGGFNSKVYNEYESSPMAFFPLPKGALADAGGAAVELTPLALGAKVYKETCINCHQATGTGQPGAVPALAGSEWVDGSEYNEKRLVAMVMKGVKGPISVKGATFNSQMQAWESMGPKKLAAVLTYVRQEWGNKGGEITEAQVAAAKKEFANHGDQFTVEEIKQIPLDAKLEGAAAPAATEAKADAKPAVAGNTTATAPATAPGAAFDLQASIGSGKAIYMQTCFACHQATGMGVPGAFPPLVGTPFIKEDPRRLVAITLKGIIGALTIDGKVYATGMPNPMLTFPQLKDDKNVADVLNYVRNNFGNQIPEPITPDFVAKVRAEFAGRDAQWTEAELLNFPPAK